MRRSSRAADAAAIAATLGRLRVTTDVDAHPFGGSGPVILAGVPIEHPTGLAGHSDADVVAHAVADALLGGAGRDDDIGTCFPDTDPEHRGADSMELLARVVDQVRSAGHQIINVDVTVMAEAPKVSPYRAAMRERLAEVLGVDRTRVTVRGTSTDGLGFLGRGEGVAVIATSLVLAGG